MRTSRPHTASVRRLRELGAQDACGELRGVLPAQARGRRAGRGRRLGPGDVEGKLRDAALQAAHVLQQLLRVAAAPRAQHRQPRHRLVRQGGAEHRHRRLGVRPPRRPQLHLHGLVELRLRAVLAHGGRRLRRLHAQIARAMREAALVVVAALAPLVELAERPLVELARGTQLRVAVREPAEPVRALPRGHVHAAQPRLSQVGRRAELLLLMGEGAGGAQAAIPPQVVRAQLRLAELWGDRPPALCLAVGSGHL
mmetsp:Transcript_32026/g.91315  ORF Transcript_32026/g.91315 Transcript_32026/m.91315 type:complete len:254 (+) Transcript_32026:333-1094(+)